MNLMISFILLFTAFGLIVRRFGKREQWILNGIAALMTLLYFLFPARFI
jgi:presenilin-like A22 family membrane protease